MLPTRFQSTGLSIQEKKKKTDFGFPIEMILAIFDLHVTEMIPTKFQLAQGYRGSRLLNQIADATQPRMHEGLTDHNNSP